MYILFFLLATISTAYLKSEHGRYFEHQRFPYPFNISLPTYTPLPIIIQGLSCQDKTDLYGLPPEQELIEKYRCKDSLINEVLKNKIIIDIARNVSLKQPVYLSEAGIVTFGEGHTPVGTYTNLNYVIKFRAAVARIQGREVLRNICARNTSLCQNIIMPEKCIVSIKEAETTLYVLLAEKLKLLNLYNDDIDLNEFLQQKSDLFERVKFLLYQAGHCDGNPGNVKITPLGDFAIIDTDLPYYLRPNSWCGTTEHLEMNYYYAIRSNQQGACFDVSSMLPFSYYYTLGKFSFSQEEICP